MKKNNLFKFAILLLTSFNAFIFAEKDIEIPEIKFDKFILDNGLTVVVHEDRKVPMVAVNVWYHVGSKNEVEGKTGFAHLFEHLMLMEPKIIIMNSLNLLKKLVQQIKMVQLTLIEQTTFKMSLLMR